MNKAKGLTIPKIEKHYAQVTVIGSSLLCQHRWAEKAKEQIRAKQEKQGAKKSGREIRNPLAEWKDSFYHDPEHPDCFVIPTECMKKAITNAAHKDIGIVRKTIQSYVWIMGDNIRIIGEPYPFAYDERAMDTVQIGNQNKVADLRYRPKFPEWSATFIVEYIEPNVSLEQILTCVQLAGFGVGVCEGRPEKTSAKGWGRFEIDTASVRELSRDKAEKALAEIWKAKGPTKDDIQIEESDEDAA